VLFSICCTNCPLKMKSNNPLSYAGIFLLTFVLSLSVKAQSFGSFASAIWLSDCNQSNFFNTTGTATNLIGPAGNVFDNANLGVHTQNSGTLILRGGEVKTFKNPASSNVCGARMHYRIYPQSGVPGSFSTVDLPVFDNCSAPTFPTGGPCQNGDQKWQRITADGSVLPYAPVNLTNYPAGTYVLEVYYDVAGSLTTTNLCGDTVLVNNGGNNYKATFSIQAPTIVSTNPTSCNGSEGSIAINGLVPGATYSFTYTDDGTTVGPLSLTANGAGQILITGLNSGTYSNFSLVINGCTTNLFTGVILSNPIFLPVFPSIPAFCAGTTAPALPASSINGISGTWSPATISNTASGTYTFTPAAGQCALQVSINVTVTPRVTPTFSFATSICDGAAAPLLPLTSNNGISGTWSPSTVSNTTSGSYMFTPNTGVCANAVTVNVAVNPNITPTFTLPSNICAGATAPLLPGTSGNGINGTWSPSTISNTASGSYTFTPTAGQCALPVTVNITVDPNITPAFTIPSSICAGATPPVLPGTSNNGITGTWSPATVSNTASGTYTFTPNGAGQCAVPFIINITVNPILTPSFSFATSICNGATAPVLPLVSNNGINGTWSPSTVSNTASGSYTFTPNVGECATPVTINVTVNPNITPAFNFATSICEGATAPALPVSSTNGINGTWSPSTISNTASGSYTFTPTAGQCAVPVTINVTVNPNITPTFSFATSICNGATSPVLPGTSNNGVTGTWSPSTISNTASGSYTFTPAAGQCAFPVTINVTVANNITPTFSITASICNGATAPTLPPTSNNGITGTWSPSTVSNTASGSYTFTPDAGQCATPVTINVTVNPIITPAFNFATSICEGATAPVLPVSSTNGINGTWSPATISNTASGSYTFTPNAGQCAVPVTINVTVNPNITPTFSFATSICEGAIAPTLPGTSGNGITGTWSPATISNTASGSYTFTPAAGQCAVPVTINVTVSNNITPTFSITASICNGATAPTLPPTSNNGITGTWSPATVSNTASGSYTFTPTAGQCATPVTINVTVNPNITPAFNFATSICDGATAPILPATSGNGITGTWSPATVSNTLSGSYTFTPTAGLCAVPVTINVTVNPILTPTFTYPASICEGSTVLALPATSNNGITGTWSPATVSNTASGTYTFTPNAGQCGTPTSINVTVTPNVTPVFSFGSTLTICSGGTVPSLPNTSDNGISGTWSPATVSTTASGTYTFTPAAGVCAPSVTFTVTVNPILTPAFGFNLNQSICIGATVPQLVTTSTNGVAGTWSPATVDNQTNGTYIFTPAAGQCATPVTLTVQVNPIPSVIVRTDTTVNDGAIVPATLFTTNPGGVTLAWTNSNPAIGLTGTGTGNVPQFTATNPSNANISGTITVTPNINGCIGTARTYVVTVRPLDKGVFVPNVFSPNNDGKNDKLMIYGNYIRQVEMRIFNQWGEQVALINSQSQGWDGTHRSKAQPVGVYVYVLRAVMTDGRTVDLKGSVTLVR
jgi:large repetitive protein